MTMRSIGSTTSAITGPANAVTAITHTIKMNMVVTSSFFQM
jgi:hypothetical protein